MSLLGIATSLLGVGVSVSPGKIGQSRGPQSRFLLLSVGEGGVVMMVVVVVKMEVVVVVEEAKSVVTAVSLSLAEAAVSVAVVSVVSLVGAALVVRERRGRRARRVGSCIVIVWRG